MRALGLLLLALTAAPADEWQRHEPGASASFPADHGAHPGFQSEWWYATGELSAADGARFGWQLTIFRRGLVPGLAAPGEPLWAPRQVFAGHLVLVEVDSGRTRVAERLRRANGALAGARQGELDAWIEDWRLWRDPGDGRVHASACARERGFALELVLQPEHAPLLHGLDGLSRKGPEPGNASLYASWTRLATAGTLTLDGRALAVRGESWFDHEWGTSQLGAGVVGWDWLGLRLDDGRELMLYRLRRADGSLAPHSGGTLVRADGSARTLQAGDVELQALGHWSSPHTAARYPARWTLRVPTEGIECELGARVPDCEIDGRRSTGVVYWEGPVEVRGGATGSGYAELTGYAGSLAGRF